MVERGGASALSYLSRFEMREVLRHLQTLSVAWFGELAAAQIAVMTPSDRARHGASVCIASPRTQAVADAERTAEAVRACLNS